MPGLEVSLHSATRPTNLRPTPNNTMIMRSSVLPPEKQQIQATGFAAKDHLSILAKAFFVATVLGVWLSGPALHAAIWSQTAAGTYDWNNNSNWDTTFPNAVGAAATFSSALGGSQTVNLNQAITVGSLSLAGTSASSFYTIAGGSGGSLNFQVSSGNVAVTVSTNGNVISSNVSLSSNTVVSPAGGATLDISGVISGAGNLTRSGGGGSGNLLLSNVANTYTGVTTIGTGQLTVTNLANGNAASSLGQSSNAASNLVFSTGGGTLIYTGGAAASTDRLFTLSSGPATIRNSGGGINFTNTGAIALGSLNNNRVLTLGGALGTSSIASSFGNNGTGLISLTKADAGTWVLSGNNTYSGTTTVSAGQLRAGRAANAFGVNSTVILANAASAVLDLDGYNNSIGSLAGGGVTGGNVTLGSAMLTVGGDNSSTSYSGVISGIGGGLTKVGAGTLTLTRGNTYTGATVVSAGTLLLDTNGGISSTEIGFGVRDSSSGLFTVNNISFAFSNTISLNLSAVTVSSATWTLFDGSAFGAGDLNLTNLTSDLVGLTFANNSGIWSGVDTLGRTWTFTEDLGQLSVVPEPSTFCNLALAGFVVTLAVRRRRKSGASW